MQIDLFENVDWATFLGPTIGIFAYTIVFFVVALIVFKTLPIRGDIRWLIWRIVLLIYVISLIWVFPRILMFVWSF